MSWRRVSMSAAHVLFTDRTGGVSSAPYWSANVGHATADDSACLAENRRRIAAAFAEPFTPRPTLPWIWLDQVHGSTVLAVPEDTQDARSDGTVPRGSISAEGATGAATATATADAAVTTNEEVALAILTADCAPLALATPQAVGAVHAGWRGLSLGVIEAAVARLQSLGEGPVEAVLGPCIRSCCYEFGSAELAPLLERYGPTLRARTTSARTTHGALALDMAEGVRRALECAGVVEFADVGICTACSPDHFSYRRDGETGRQVMLVARHRGEVGQRC